MTKMTRFLALIPVVAFATACSGVTPTGPSQIASNDAYEAVSGEATAMGIPCPTLVRISLEVVDSRDAILWVQATYHHSRPNPAPCAAPRWMSDRKDMVVDKLNPMRAGFPRFAGGKGTLTAIAANRVSKSIRVDLDPTTRVAEGDGACREIARVDVAIVPSPDTYSDVAFVATYLFKKPVSGDCAVAPAWEASRRGLKVQATDPFRASIPRLSGIRTQVTATAPNGASGSITF